MSFSFSTLADALKAGTPISAADVLAARRWAWEDGGINPAEAESIFALNQLSRDPSPEWTDFFVEAMTEFVVNQQQPRGYVDEANAAWLIAQVDKDGRVDTMAELELIVKVLETALNAPQSLKSYALRQIEAVVLSGEGPTRRGGPIQPGRIDEAELPLLRRLIFARSGEGALVVSRDEAEMLWRLKDATAGADNAPGWKTLFVQALGNHLMAYGSYQPLERAEAARLETFMNDRSVDPIGFIGRMLKGSAPTDAAKPEVDHFARAAAEQEVTGSEASWLKARIDADGKSDPLEQALLDFIAEESGARP